MSANSVIVVYDGECPFCQRYVAMVRLRQAFGEARLINARSDDPLAVEARSRFDMDEGMAALIGGQWYHGADCMHALALASGRSGFANRIVAKMFMNPRRARLLYPMLRAGRNAALRVLGKQKIASSK